MDSDCEYFDHPDSDNNSESDNPDHCKYESAAERAEYEYAKSGYAKCGYSDRGYHKSGYGKSTNPENDAPSIAVVPSIVPVILTAILLFLAINGPRNWPAVWNELAHPPPDARHAIRKQSPHFRLSQTEIELRRAQLMSYVNSVEQSLETSVRDEQSRLVTVERIYAGIGLDEHRSKQVAALLEGLSMTSIRAALARLQRFADTELRAEGAQQLRQQFLDRTAKFLDQLQQLANTRNGL